MTLPTHSPQGTRLFYKPFQEEVFEWLKTAFAEDVYSAPKERAYRFLEEALELAQAAGLSKEEACRQVDYTFSRPIGETAKEVGGVMVTLAALCQVAHVDMEIEGWQELRRVLRPEVLAKIQAKQVTKDLHGGITGIVPLSETNADPRYTALLDKYTALLSKTTKVRAAQKDYFRGNKSALTHSKLLERELDAMLLEANKADNLQQDLF